MTQRETLLRPLEPAQRLAPADRETLEATLASVGDCASLIAEQGAARQETTERQIEALRTFADAVGRLSERIDGHAEDGAARHAELMEAVREARAAVAGLATRHDENGEESAAGVRTDLAALNGALERFADTLGRHDRRLAAVTDAVPVLSAAAEALREETRGARAERNAAQDRQTRTLGDVVRRAASLGRRFGRIEQALKRERRDFWLNGVAIPLLIGCAFFFGLMTDFTIRYLDRPAVTAVPGAAELPPLPLPPNAFLEIVTPE